MGVYASAAPRSNELPPPPPRDRCGTELSESPDIGRFDRQDGGMSVRYSPDPAVWISVPRDAAADWARQAAAGVAPAAPWLVSALVEAGQNVEDAEDRLVLVHASRQQAVVVDLDVLDLGDALPDREDPQDGTATTEEFTAGDVHGTRTVWVSPVPGAEGSGEDALQAQALFVGGLTGTGYLVTLRTGQLQLDLVVDTLARCEELLATAAVD